MVTRTMLFEQFLQYPVPTYFEKWPPTPTDGMGLLAVTLIILALDRDSYLKVRDNTIAYWEVFICSKK